MKGVYLSFPIDQSGKRPVGVEDAKGWLKTQDVSWVYDPGSAFSAGLGARTPAIRAINLEALAQADILIAFLPAKAVTIGVPMEIQRAIDTGKSVVVVSDAPSWMLETGFPVVATWSHAVPYVSEALERPSPALTDSGRLRMPVVVSEGAEGPRRGYDDDAGLDLVVSEDTLMQPGVFTDVPCGVSAALPAETWGMIVGRSSTLRNKGLLVNQGVIDCGYRGPLFAGAWNLGDRHTFVRKGDRIAQLIIIENVTARVDVQTVDELPAGSRGTRGFGSTGR